MLLTETLLTMRQWLISKGRNAEAKAMLTKYHANGLEGDPLVEWEYAEIVAVLHQETVTPKSHYVSIRAWLPWVGRFADVVIRRTSSRHLETDADCWSSLCSPLAATGWGMVSCPSGFAPWFCDKRTWMCSRVTSYLSPVLKQLGVTNATDITGINAGLGERSLSPWRDFRDLTLALAVFNLIVSLTSAVNIERAGRRKMFITSMLGMIGSYAIVMGLSAGFALKGNVAMGTAAIPFLFVFNGFSDIAWTPVSR
jgi:hypothetical protein